MTKEEYEELKGLFDMFDVDESGSISLVEIKSIMRMVGKNPTD